MVKIDRRDLDNVEISRLIYQHKRLMLQRFLDPEKGIVVKDRDNIEVNFSLSSLKRLKREWRFQ